MMQGRQQDIRVGIHQPARVPGKMGHGGHTSARGQQKATASGIPSRTQASVQGYEAGADRIRDAAQTPHSEVSIRGDAGLGLPELHIGYPLASPAFLCRAHTFIFTRTEYAKRHGWRNDQAHPVQRWRPRPGDEKKCSQVRRTRRPFRVVQCRFRVRCYQVRSRWN